MTIIPIQTTGKVWADNSFALKNDSTLKFLKSLGNGQSEPARCGARCTTDMRDNHVTNDTGGGGDDDDDDDDDDDNHDDDDDEFYGLQQQA